METCYQTAAQKLIYRKTSYKTPKEKQLGICREK